MRAHESALGLPVLMPFGWIFQNFLVYMFFLLVVLLLNYSDSGKDTHGLRLRAQLQRALHAPDYHNVSRYTPTRSPSIKKMFILQISEILTRFVCKMTEILFFFS